jgi:hypothetical protein
LSDRSTSCSRSPGRIPVHAIGYGCRSGAYHSASRRAVSRSGRLAAPA